ncbi:hypothetical protein GOP47_0007543 [Adiantum capillus-veneris]|uniref:Uncharacterized protein n=1 Tax=Adiantum capillus-veneris TaxID=13818 RepID=A0A9D4V185_ADICA|nr:hypothetical protein GOP47_0007543 [Adiantum capillus-veneris]
MRCPLLRPILLSKWQPPPSTNLHPRAVASLYLWGANSSMCHSLTFSSSTSHAMCAHTHKDMLVQEAVTKRRMWRDTTALIHMIGDLYMVSQGGSIREEDLFAGPCLDFQFFSDATT